MSISPQTAYANLQLVDQVDIASSAIYRQQAQDIIADPKVSLGWRQAIADRLNYANHLLSMNITWREDCY